MIARWLAGAMFAVGVSFAAAVVSADEIIPQSDEYATRVSERTDLPCFAQVVDQRPVGPGADWRRQGPGMEQRKHLEQLRILKMLELLNLSQEQELPFLTAFNAMRERQRRIDDQINRTVDSLAQEIDGGRASDPRLNKLIDHVRDLESEKLTNVSSFLDRMRGLLTPEQVGKLIIFQKRFEAELLERVGRFRRGMGPGDPEGGG